MTLQNLPVRLEAEETFVCPEKQTHGPLLIEIRARLSELSVDVASLHERLDTHIGQADKALIQVQEQADFVHDLMESQRMKTEFWREVFKRVAAASIWGIMLLVSAVVWYAVVHWLGHRGDNP